MEKDFDLGIIGSGPAGYTAALAAKGLSVVIFEEKELGGTCLNRGCIPTKAILHSAELFNQIKSAENAGIFPNDPCFDWKKIIERKDEKVEKLKKMLELSIKNSGATVVNSHAELVGVGKIKDSDGNIYNCKKVIVATGSKPRQIKGLEFDGEQILSSDDVLNLDDCPKSIVIIGSGAIGIEWARIFSAFGCDVVIVEMAQHLLPLADIEVSKRLERIFKLRGIKFYLTNSVDFVDKTGKDLKLTLKTGEILVAEKILVAVGREIVSLKETYGAKVIGDASGEIQLAHYATRQAL